MGLVLGFMGFLSTGCYLLRQGTALIGTYSSAKPLEEVLRAQDLSPQDRGFIERAQSVRKFALERLGMKENKNYTTFIRTQKPYLADVVSACASDSFDQYLWDYPFLGKMPYQGFFDRKEAEEEGARLKALNQDVMIRGVDAFSTLGWFSDPLFSYMTGYSEFRTAELLIHEMTHATIFLNGQGDFNENLAMFVGMHGALEYLKATHGEDSPLIKSAQAEDADSDTFREDLHRLYLSLDLIYKNSQWDREKKLQEKDLEIQNFQKEFGDTYSARYLTDNYKGFSQRPINNAYLMTYRNYNSGQGEFQSFYEAQGSNLVTMLEALKKMPKDEKDPLGWMKNQKTGE